MSESIPSHSSMPSFAQSISSLCPCYRVTQSISITICSSFRKTSRSSPPERLPLLSATIPSVLIPLHYAVHIPTSLRTATANVHVFQYATTAPFFRHPDIAPHLQKLSVLQNLFIYSCQCTPNKSLKPSVEYISLISFTLSAPLPTEDCLRNSESHQFPFYRTNLQVPFCCFY